MKTWMEKLIMILTIFGSVAGGMFYLDNKYATAADLRQLEVNLKRDRAIDRMKDINNKIFELEFKQRNVPQKFDALDAAVLDRYKNELADLQRRSRDLER